MIRRDREYRATVSGVSLRFLADTDKNMIWVYSQQRIIGGFDVERFGGRLDRAGIGQFIADGTALRASAS